LKKNKSFGLTDTGIVRSSNQDSIYLCDDGCGLCFPNCYIVADGLGGHRGGEVASKKSIEYFLEYLEENPELTDDEYIKKLNQAVSYANSMIFTMSEKDRTLQGMGTTFSCCVVIGNVLYISHVGDSRIYLFRDNEIKQLSKDHTLVNELVEMGQITKEEASTHPQHHIITKALGTYEFIEPFNALEGLAQNDIVLLCSDGLTNMVDDEILVEILKFGKTPEETVMELIAEANGNGGKDNISAIIINAEVDRK
jgi:protein phosphatase